MLPCGLVGPVVRKKLEREEVVVVVVVVRVDFLRLLFPRADGGKKALRWIISLRWRRAVDVVLM